MTYAYLTDHEATQGLWTPWHPTLNEFWPYESGRSRYATVTELGKAERRPVRFYRRGGLSA